eukprot:scaffold27848_cov149-Isochrysis_galbana.AAC.1
MPPTKGPSACLHVMPGISAASPLVWAAKRLKRADGGEGGFRTSANAHKLAQEMATTRPGRARDDEVCIRRGAYTPSRFFLHG